jgi:DNA phosphorothioation-dependent restriction protein DptG
MSDLFKDIIPSILQTKKEVVSADNERDYVPFIVNRALSQHMDCIMQANQMNIMNSTDNLLQFHYLLNTIRSYKRPFQKWHKREESENLEAIKEYYNYSNEKAKEALLILSNDQLNEIKKNLNKGGLNAKPRRLNTGGAK